MTQTFVKPFKKDDIAFGLRLVSHKNEFIQLRLFYDGLMNNIQIYCELNCIYNNKIQIKTKCMEGNVEYNEYQLSFNEIKFSFNFYDLFFPRSELSFTVHACSNRCNIYSARMTRNKVPRSNWSDCGYVPSSRYIDIAESIQKIYY